jgi:aspartate carbamoyltransferase catalytic subunit
MLRLGGEVITVNDESSSLMKGESIADTIRTVSEYADVIVVRCNEPYSRWGTVDCPIINAGDSFLNHPTQALADLYTIHHSGLPDAPKVGASGDIGNSRTIRSFSEIMEWSGSEVFLYDSTEEEGLSEFEAMLPDFDVLYLNRVQTERRIHGPQCHASCFNLSQEHLDVMKKDAVILNPGPRKEEMSAKLEDHRIKFWDQVANGLYIRMAILRHIFGCKT